MVVVSVCLGESFFFFFRIVGAVFLCVNLWCLMFSLWTRLLVSSAGTVIALDLGTSVSRGWLFSVCFVWRLMACTFLSSCFLGLLVGVGGCVLGCDQ